MVVDFKKSEVEHPPLYVGDQIVERVSEYEYLGTIIQNKFTFASNVTMCTKTYSQGFTLHRIGDSYQHGSTFRPPCLFPKVFFAKGTHSFN